MSNGSQLDQFPVELLHILFGYFSASELLVTFHYVSDYISLTLESYPTYNLDFRSISKSNFRRVCRHIRPEQVISLTLADDDDTPGQSELFFHRFQIEQFTRLRSLTLLPIELNSLESIFVNLPQLHNLRSLSFDALTIRHTYGALHLDSPSRLEKINAMLRHTYAQVFPRLSYLQLNGGWVLESISLPTLRYLKLGSCPMNKLKSITSLAPELRSLDIHVHFDQMGFTKVSLPGRLTRFTLKIHSGFPVPMNYIEYLLSNCLCHKHLQLHLGGGEGLADGQRWQKLTNALITFNFEFHVHLHSSERTLQSFRTAFWLEKKQWFVAYQDQCLFSIPLFSPRTISATYRQSVHHTAPDDAILYKNVRQLTLTSDAICKQRFTHIDTLEVHQSISRTKLSRWVDLRHVKHLSVLALDDLLSLPTFGCEIAHQCQLSVKNLITRKEIERMISRSYSKIRILRISVDFQQDQQMIEELFRLFPNTVSLVNKSDIQSIDIMARIIDGFTQLSNASFLSRGPLYNENETFRYDPDLIILRIKRLIYGISVCRIYHLANSTTEFSINWWIEE